MRTGSYGSATIAAPATRVPRGASIAERLAAFSEPDPAGCILWTGTAPGHGYGLIRLSNPRRQREAHIVSYELHVGRPVPAGMQLDHLCHNADPDCPGGPCKHRRCINPAHLEPVTPRENLVRAPRYRGNVEKRKTHCPQGHAYTPENITMWRNERRCRACSRVRSRAWYAAKVER